MITEEDLDRNPRPYEQDADASRVTSAPGPVRGLRTSMTPSWRKPHIKDVGGPMRGDEFAAVLVISPAMLQFGMLARSWWLVLALFAALVVVQAGAIMADRRRIRHLLGELPSDFPPEAWFVFPAAYLAARARSLNLVADFFPVAWCGALLVGLASAAMKAFM